MNRRLAAEALLIVGAVALIDTDSLADEQFKRLKGQQIQARFAGMEMTDEVHWRDIYERDGTIRTLSMGRGTAGKWWVQGDELCHDRGEEFQGCYEVWVSGSKVQLRREGLEDVLEGVLQRSGNRN